MRASSEYAPAPSIPNAAITINTNAPAMESQLAQRNSAIAPTAAPPIAANGVKRPIARRIPTPKQIRVNQNGGCASQ